MPRRGRRGARRSQHALPDRRPKGIVEWVLALLGLVLKGYAGREGRPRTPPRDRYGQFRRRRRRQY